MTRKRVLGLEHLDTLTRMSILASTLLNQGLWKEAEQLETQVVETSFRMLGLEHPARDAGQHGWPCIKILFNHGRWKGAEEIGMQVMETRKKVLGLEHSNMLMSMGNFGQFLFESRPAEGGRGAGWRYKSLEPKKRMVGPDHPKMLISMNNLAVTF